MRQMVVGIGLPELSSGRRATVGALVDRWGGPLAFGLTLLLLGFAGLRLYATATLTFAGLAGYDLGHYLDGTRRWIETGTPYLASEVAAPFDYAPLTFLHPPTSLPFFAAFLVLPPILWWALPIGIVAAVVAAYRPAAWTWPLMAAGLITPGFATALVVGNSNIWVWAFFALAVRFKWPAAVLAAFKPSLMVLGLAGMGRSSTWMVASLIGFSSLVFGSLWWQWVMVVINSPAGWNYSLGNLPWLVLPAFAFLGRTSNHR